MRGIGVAVTCALVLAWPAAARAGGFELPDNGTQALGRGGAFTAKADDPTAIEYNPAGLARQRGTRLLFDANVVFNTTELQRAGVYPDSPTDPKTPWGGAFFPRVTNQGGPFFAPFIAATSDFGLDRFTFAVGVFGPSGVGKRTYPLGVAGAPSAARYDVVQTNNLIAYPTLAVGYRASRELDLGISLHAVYSSVDLVSTTYTDVSTDICKNAEYHPCDALNEIQANAWSYAATVGASLRPDDWLAFAASVRTPITIDADGTASVIQSPPALNAPVDKAPAQFHTKLPLVVRGGVRFIFMDQKLERGDVEIDGTYERWSDAQGTGPTIDIPQLSIFKDIHPLVAHGYGDTFSLRAGAAYNWRALGGVMTLRGGAYYDKSATETAFTRVDFDTLDKYAGTVGIGFEVAGIQFNAAYAEVFSPERVVTDGQIRPINGANHGAPAGPDNVLLPAVNNGIYDAHNRILSLGVTVRFDELLGGDKKRVVRYGADYEDVEGGEGTEPAKAAPPPPKHEEEETKPENDQDDGASTFTPPEERPLAKRSAPRRAEPATARVASPAPAPPAPAPAKKSDWDE